MHKILLLFISLLCLQCSPSYDAALYQAFPGLDEVVTAYYTANPDKLEEYNEFIKFEKHKDGWYVTLAKRTDYENPYQKDKIWDLKEKKYLITPRKTKEADEAQIKEKFRAVASLNAFLWPVFGYEGAAKDVIKLLGKTNPKKLSAAQLEGLARAYEEQANYSYLGNYGHAYNKSASRLYDSTFDVRSLDSKLMEEAEANAWKSIECYKNLAVWHPEHLTILGTIKMKYADNPVAHYLNFDMFQQRETAKKFMDAAEFTEDMTEMAKNYLRSCPPNAILLTYGDNDTYPLLYVQQKLNFRNDVTVMNRSLMAVGRCIYYYTQLLPEQQRVKSSLGMDHYRLDINNYQHIQASERKEDKPIPISSVFAYFENKGAEPGYYNANENRMVFPTKKIQLGEHINIELKKTILMKDELFLMDLISSNYPSRPICFTQARFDGVYGELKPYLEMQGLVSVLTDSAALSRGYFSRLNKSVLEEKLLKEFIYPKTEVSDAEYRPVLSVIMVLHLELMGEYKALGDSINEKKILDHLHKVLPIDKFNYSGSHATLAKVCLEFAEKEKAKQHLIAYATELEKDLKEAKIPLNEQTALQRFYARDNVKGVEEEVERLVLFAENNGFQELALEFRKRLK